MSINIGVTGYSPKEIQYAYPAQSYEERLESLLSYFDHQPTFISRGKYSNNDPRNNVGWVRGFWEDGVYVKEWSFSKNIITTDGRIYYAKRGAVLSPAADEGATHVQLANPTTQNPVAVNDTWDTFDSAVAGNGAAGSGAAISGSIIAFTSGYPKIPDDDPDNTGDGNNVISYQAFYSAASFGDGGTNIKNGVIMGDSTPVNATKLVCHFQTPTGAGVQKTVNQDTLKVMINHTVSSS